MPDDDRHLDEQGRALLTVLTPLIELEAELPPGVVEAAKALFDWARVDAELAAMAPALVTTRADAQPLVWEAQGVQVRVEVEPLGYRRRRVVVLVTPPAEAGAMTVEVQQVDGSSATAQPDALGDYVADLTSGSIRVIARGSDRSVTTPWFQI